MRTLSRAGELLAPSGIVVTEVDHHSTAVGNELLRWETEHHVGQWFPWSRVDAAALSDIAATAGFVITSVVEIKARVIAVLARP